MIEKYFFKQPINIELSVATLGVNKDDWFCYRPGMQTKFVENRMNEKGFDIVPILNKQGTFNKYYLFDENKNLKIKTIVEDDKLYYLTHVSDAIWKMNCKKRTHYFLTNGKDDNDVVGLLSLSNFNSREFYVYLFNLISYVEKEFSYIIESDVETAFMKLEEKADNIELKDQLKIVTDRYYKDRKNDSENNFKEYLYLHHLIWLVASEDKYKLLDYSKESEFIKHTGKIKSIRNNVAHPVKSLVRNLDDMKNLHIGLSKIYDLKNRVESYLASKAKL